MTLKALLGVLAMILALGVSVPADAQQVGRAAPAPGQRVLKLGQMCQRRTDTRPAVARRDACGRWYCGRKDVGEIAQVDPGFAQRMGCQWTIQADNRCICKRASFRVVPPQRAKMSFRPG
ncbi:MAG: hypothetical protein V4597_08760 [Pseudomonadota bacterium]